MFDELFGRVDRVEIDLSIMPVAEEIARFCTKHVMNQILSVQLCRMGRPDVEFFRIGPGQFKYGLRKHTLDRKSVV